MLGYCGRGAGGVPAAPDTQIESTLIVQATLLPSSYLWGKWGRAGSSWVAKGMTGAFLCIQIRLGSCSFPATSHPLSFSTASPLHPFSLRELLGSCRVWQGMDLGM